MTATSSTDNETVEHVQKRRSSDSGRLKIISTYQGSKEPPIFFSLSASQRLISLQCRNEVGWWDGVGSLCKVPSQPMSEFRKAIDRETRKTCRGCKDLVGNKLALRGFFFPSSGPLLFFGKIFRSSSSYRDWVDSSPGTGTSSILPTRR